MTISADQKDFESERGAGAARRPGAGAARRGAPWPGRRRVQPLQRRGARRLRDASCSTRAACSGARCTATTSCWSTAGQHARRAPRRRAHRDVHPCRHPPPGRQGLRPAHPHALCDGADAHRGPAPRHHAVAERDALSRPRGRRCPLQRPGARCVRGRADRPGHGRCRRASSSATTASSSAASAWTTPTTTCTTSSGPAWRRCWRSRPAGRWCRSTRRSPRACASRRSSERLQSELFFEALRRGTSVREK